MEKCQLFCDDIDIFRMTPKKIFKALLLTIAFTTILVIVYVQLNFLQFSKNENINWEIQNGKPHEYKAPVILLWTGFHKNRTFGLPINKQDLLQKTCGLTAREKRTCFFTINEDHLTKSDALVFHHRNINPDYLPLYRDPRQLWIFYTKESPLHTRILNHNMSDLKLLDGLFNWTATYSVNSDIREAYGYTKPIVGKTKAVKDKFKVELPGRNITSIFVKQKKLMLILMSNSRDKLRIQLYKTISQYLDVDAYGHVFKKRDPCKRNKTCMGNVVKQYKFYLAFENSNCDEYITEKFWRILSYGPVPVAFGAPIQHYKEMAPPDSFLHIENFTSIKHLTDYINFLDKNFHAYQKYFAWRKKYQVTAFGKSFLCQLCSRMHQRQQRNMYLQNPQFYSNLSGWWSPERLCRKDHHFQKFIKQHIS